MINKERENIINNAIKSNDINMMENVYIMCCNWNIKGIEHLRKTIIEVKEKIR